MFFALKILFPFILAIECRDYIKYNLTDVDDVETRQIILEDLQFSLQNDISITADDEIYLQQLKNEQELSRISLVDLSFFKIPAISNLLFCCHQMSLIRITLPGTLGRKRISILSTR